MSPRSLVLAWDDSDMGRKWSNLKEAMLRAGFRNDETVLLTDPVEMLDAIRALGKAAVAVISDNMAHHVANPGIPGYAVPVVKASLAEGVPGILVCTRVRPKNLPEEADFLSCQGEPEEAAAIQRWLEEQRAKLRNLS